MKTHLHMYRILTSAPNKLTVAVRQVLFGLIILPTLPAIATNNEPPNLDTATNIYETAIDAENANLATSSLDGTLVENTIHTTSATETDERTADDSVFSDSVAAQTTQNTADTVDSSVAENTTPTDNLQETNTKSSLSESTKKVAHRLGFKDTEQQSQSLAKLSEHYHAQPSATARCQGTWVQPKRANLSTSADTTERGNVPPQAGFLYAQADYGYWDAKDYAELSGNVVVEQNGQQIIADKVILDTKTGQAKALGQVQFSDGATGGNSDKSALGGGLIGIAQEINYDTNGNTANARDVAFASTTINAHGYAGEMKKVSDAQYQMQDVMFSTCPPTERKWHLDAASIDINSDTGRAVARNTTLRISDIPVLYLPYFNFPIDDRRHSGFLLPTVGFGATGSLEVSTPYYFNLAPNYDATITPTIFTNRNPMLTGEFRYLTQNYGGGTLTASYLPSDRKYQDKTRNKVYFDHRWQSKKIDNLNAYAQYQYVSDADYASDFDSLGVEMRTLNLPRRIGVNYYNENISADLRFEGFQHLDGKNPDGSPIADKDRPYSRLPQLSVNYQLPKTWLNTTATNLQVGGVHNSAYFKKSIKDNSQAEKSGVRIYNQVHASYPMLRPWGYVTPKIALNHLYISYDEDSLAGQNLDKKDGGYSVFAPTVSVDAGAYFEKSGSPFGLYNDKLGGYQVISPRLKYTYTPFKNQEKLPNFDTSISAISYNQLLSDSWFLGYDRIQDLHAVTPALNYQYIDKDGITRFDGSIAEQILLDEPRVGIDGSERFTGRSTGLAWQASAQPKDSLWIDTSGALTTNYSPSSLIAQVRYQPDAQRLFNVGIIDRKAHKATNQLPLSAYTASAIFPIGHRWQMLGQAQYDYKNKRLLDSLLGVNYEDCCYGLSLYARRYRDNLDAQAKTNTAVMVEVRLNGITTGGKLNRLLNDKIMGYDGVQNSWKQAY